ncbi:MAG: ATP-binding cassette domain-containing protein, partial [Candidatus Hodarchaeales archaeon]
MPSADTSQVIGATPEENILLEVRNLSKHFEGLKAVDNVSFSLGAGELVGIIGPNGAGKTTLFNVLTGFLKPEEGSSVIFGGKDVTNWSTFKMAKIGMARTFQLVKPFKMLDALENATVPHIPKNLRAKS